MCLFWYSCTLYLLLIYKTWSRSPSQYFSSRDAWKIYFSWILWSSLPLALSPHHCKDIEPGLLPQPKPLQKIPGLYYKSSFSCFHIARSAFSRAEIRGQWLLISFNTQKDNVLLLRCCPTCSHYNEWFMENYLSPVTSVWCLSSLLLIFNQVIHPNTGWGTFLWLCSRIDFFFFFFYLFF